MNPIKEFFRKKKAELKFTQAGPGHKLNEGTSKSGKGSSGQSSSKQPSKPLQYSEEARRAGEAALARIEQRQSSVNWSVQATKSQARRELEIENAMKSKPAAPTHEIVITDACPTLTVSGVYFTCPIIGPEILPKKEIKDKIRNFLYEQLQEEMGLTSCLIIHTLNENKEKASVGIETLSRYLTNIIDNPEEKKYRRIRINNKAFQERVICLEGALEFLTAAGFQKQVEENEEYFVFTCEGDEDLENLQMLKEAILSAEPIYPVLDRNLKVLKPSQITMEVNLPKDFFNLSVDEVKREQDARTETVELMTQLRTKAMREKDQIKELHIYKFTLIRIRFPDEVILQGTFYVHEKLSTVKEFITENLVNPCSEYNLLLPGGMKLIDDNSSLLELKLVPAVILNFMWSHGISSEKGAFLKPSIMSLLSEL